LGRKEAKYHPFGDGGEIAEWQVQTKGEDDLTLKQKGCQITFARSYPKMFAILPSIR
jgi:hypothetical protein